MSHALAQSVSGVSGTDVTPGDGVEYRFAYSPENDGKDEGFTHRLNYHHSFDEAWRVRGFVVMNRRGAQALKAKSATLEVLYQFFEDQEHHGWDSGIRADGVIPLEDNRPGRARLAWLNAFHPDAQWEIRANFYIGREFGVRAKDGFIIETREEVTYKLPSGLKIGAHMLDNYGASAHFGSFNDQKHQLGPIVKGKLGANLKYELSALFGLSRAASDADFRFFISCAL